MLVNREKREIIQVEKFKNYNNIQGNINRGFSYIPIEFSKKKPHTFFYKLSIQESSLNEKQTNIEDFDDLFFIKSERTNFLYDNFVVDTFKLINIKKEKHLKKYYSDPFSSMWIFSKYRSIYESEEKFTIVLWEQEKKRFFNFKYFKKRIKKTILSINKKTGNIITINGSRIKQNCFFEIFDIIQKICQQIDDNKKFYTDTFNNEIFFDKVEKFLKNINLEITNEKFKIDDVKDGETMIKNILKYFIFKRKLVVPDNYKILFNFYPGENFLKKNNRNMLSSILLKNNINRKSIYKSFLQYLNIQQTSLILRQSYEKKIHMSDYTSFSNMLKNFKILQKIFGNEFESYFGKTNKSFSVGTNYNESEFEEISNVEKIKFVKILKTVENESELQNVFRDLIDHLVMLKKIREIQNISLKSNTHKTFVEEHLLITKYFRLLKRGVVVTNLYPIEMIKKLEEPIIFDGNIYKPYVLKKTEDYIEEGLYMNHCVSGYDTVKSVIISIRKDNERITNEYDLMGVLLQTRGKYNSKPTDDFLEINKIIYKKIKNLYYDGDFIQKKEEVKTFMLDTIEELKF